MDSKPVTIPAAIRPVREKVDGSATISFDTPELTDSDLLYLRHLKGVSGWLLYSPNEIDLVDIPETQADTGLKSQSQRLRAVLYVQYQQLGMENVVDFPTFYHQEMEKRINEVKSTLS